MPIALIAKLVRTFLARTAATIFAFARSIPTIVYALIAFAAALTLAYLLLTTRSDLRQTQRELASSESHVKKLGTIYGACLVTLDKQTDAILTLKRTSDAVTTQANANLKAAQARARQAQALIADLRSRPTPPASQQCAASDALINELLDASH